VLNEVARVVPAVLAALLISGCAHAEPPKPRPAEEPIVMAASPGGNNPIPEIDPNTPLKHANDVKIPPPTSHRR
jgi:hypothetical protein